MVLRPRRWRRYRHALRPRPKQLLPVRRCRRRRSDLSGWPMNASARFSGKRIVVTGAGRGLGFAFAERLGREGASVVVAEIDVALGADAERKLKASGIDAR